MKKLLILLFAGASSLSVTAQQQNSMNYEADKAAVIVVVKRFLTAAGDYDIESMPAMFTDNANIGGASLRNGKWSTYTVTLEGFLERLRSERDPKKYTEPVSEFTVHMAEGMLAFVMADALIIRNGHTQAKNFDYFTLIKQNGDWRILNGSYVSIPVED